MSETATSPAVTGIHHFSPTVSDVEASAQWYERVFGMSRVPVTFPHHGDEAGAVAASRQAVAIIVTGSATSTSISAVKTTRTRAAGVAGAALTRSATAPGTAPAGNAPPAAPNADANELADSAPLTPQASAAAAAASADLKTLEEQIAANPPSGAASSPTADNRGNGANADAMEPGGYLGQTVDLYDGQSILPAPARRSLDSLHRRARPRWRHGWGHQ